VRNSLSNPPSSPKAGTTPGAGFFPTPTLADATIEAEVLSSVVLSEDPEKLRQLHLRDFIFPETKAIFRILRQMGNRGDPIDLPSVLRHCVEKGMEREVTLEILNSSPTATLFPHQLYRLKELSNKRIIAKATEKLNEGKITIEQFKQLTQKLNTEEGNFLPEPLPMEELFTDEPIVSILGNFLFQGALHLLSSDPGVGKTTFLYHLAVNLAEGREFLGEKLPTLKVAYFDLETPQTLRSNLLQLLEFQSNSNLLFFDQPCPVENLKSLVNKHKIDLLIIDVVSLFFSLKKEEDNSEVNNKIIQPLKEVTKETGVAIILVHHNSKGSKERSKVYKSRGASALPGGCDVVINLEVTEEDDIRKLEIAKNRLTGYTPKLYTQKQEDDFTVVEKPDSEFTKTQRLEYNVLDLLKENSSLSTGQLTRLTGAPERTLFRAINNLLITGKIEKEARGIYCLKNKKNMCEIDGRNGRNYLKPAPDKALNSCQQTANCQSDVGRNGNSVANSAKVFNYKEEKYSFSLENKEKSNLPKNKYSGSNGSLTANSKMVGRNLAETQTSVGQGFEGLPANPANKNAEKKIFPKQENKMDLITSETTIEELEQMKNKNIYQIAKISGFSEEQSYALWSWSNKLPDPYAKEVISSILKRKRGEEENGNQK